VTGNWVSTSEIPAQNLSTGRGTYLLGLFRVLLGLVSRFLFQGRLGFPDLLHPFRLVCHPCG
jgi:hypothetical protein